MSPGELEARVTGCSLPDGGGDVVVPGTIEGCPVVSVELDLGVWSGDSEATVDVTACERLRELEVYSYSDTRLDASGCADLVRADLQSADITWIDVSGCASLAELYLYGPSSRSTCPALRPSRGSACARPVFPPPSWRGPSRASRRSISSGTH